MFGSPPAGGSLVERERGWDQEGSPLVRLFLISCFGMLLRSTIVHCGSFFPARLFKDRAGNTAVSTRAFFCIFLRLRSSSIIIVSTRAKHGRHVCLLGAAVGPPGCGTFDSLSLRMYRCLHVRHKVLGAQKLDVLIMLYFAAGIPARFVILSCFFLSHYICSLFVSF